MAGKSVTKPNCHPGRSHLARDLCAPCYRRRSRAIKKAAGYPEWVRDRITYATYLRKLKRRRELNTPEQRRVVNARYRQKQRDLYGGTIDKNPVARFRWAMAKSGLLPTAE